MVSPMPAKLQNEVHDIDKRLVHIEAVLEEMKTNHLAHIEKSMESLDAKYTKIDDRLWAVSFGIMVQALAVAVGVAAFLANMVWG